ncbi:MAG: helix-turn-helix domain-containing protein [Scytonematopsis contorta HA4267-MV1]|nr:helix-turn-helix domain-containing protein [Scytonematopsis contorta HA4267-MV1]
MEQLTVKQYLAITHLAAGATNLQAADAVGVSESSIEKWKRRADFQLLLKESVRRVYDAAIAELACGAIDSARELRTIINNPDAPDRVKIQAIQVLFSQLQNARNWEFENRVERLEAMLDASEEDTTIRKTLPTTATTNGFKP